MMPRDLGLALILILAAVWLLTFVPRRFWRWPSTPHHDAFVFTRRLPNCFGDESPL